MPTPLPLNALSPLLAGTAPLVLLESARNDPENHRSYLFQDPFGALQAWTAEEIPELLERLESWRGRCWVAGYLCYEAAYGLEPRLRHLAKRADNGAPLAWFGLFEAPAIFDHRRGRWLSEPKPNTGETDAAPGDGCGDYAPGIDEAAYGRGYRRIQAYLDAGDSYQVNYTFPGIFHSPLPAPELYGRLRSQQRVPYGAFIRHPERTILSFSPELFFRTDGTQITARPMKGTALRGLTPAADRRQRRALAADPKSRAENLMIVDLLRNDLGRLCRPGSVAVPQLFAVEAHRTVLQMTSTVTGTLSGPTPLPELFRALFPCGSVTGAPKLRTMEIIAELEAAPRGVYCGAIGFTAPGGEAVFSVPIRTLERPAGDEHWQFHTGSGVVHGAPAAAEWQECLAKAAFLTEPGQRFELLETLALREGVAADEADHRRRMAASARHWGYPFSPRRWREEIEALGRKHSHGAHLVRLLLNEEGVLRSEISALAEAPWPTLPAPVRLRPEPVDPANPYLYHKTTHRPWYRESLERIRRGEWFDEIFLNTRGELTEGARSNVFVELDGTLYTPPLAAGLLPGVLRSALLREGRCRERVLHPADLRRATNLYCGNSVRGLVPVRLAGLTERQPMD